MSDQEECTKDGLVCVRCKAPQILVEVCTLCQKEHCDTCHPLHACLIVEPQRWVLPPEPGPEVTKLRDSREVFWVRYSNGWTLEDLSASGRKARGSVSWELVLGFGPLVDATQDTTP
jgi:hypothetical protein